jgi:hypothetical protein
VEIEVAGGRYVACLGKSCLPVDGLGLATGADGWVELLATATHAYVGGVEWSPRATLLAGDAIAIARSGDVVVKVVST